MKYKLLTGDNIDGLGWTLSDRLKSMGLTAIRCSNCLSALEAGCAKHEPDALVFFVTTVRDELYDFVGRMVGKYPNMRIFVLSYVKSYGLRRRLEDLGVTDYFLMPDLLSEICRYIFIDLQPADEQQLTLDIMHYLERKGVTRVNSGFVCMCTAMKVCVLKPEALTTMTLRLYPCIAYKLGMTPESVEQTLRRFGKYIAEQGVRFERHKGSYPVNNANMISLALDEFTEMFDQYE
ncbi:MAG: sporulation initiation factor Spo0A C-terminal domain-containing protein [Ruminococcus sp.]|nr:sporulation initiation factor Spo0A C-terminal domain-containing protein [Ruminococcus sp.]